MLDLYLRRLKEDVLAPAASLFTFLHPNTITSIGFVFGLACAFYAAQAKYFTAMILWTMNRIVDGLDGVVARKTNRQSDFGGYWDIVTDFTVYALVPIGLVYSDPSETRWLLVPLLEGVYFVNSASLFHLSSLLEKRALGAKQNQELTGVTMPVGLIEGSETVIFYSLFIVYHSYLSILFIIFGLLVLITIVQRVWWASSHLESHQGKCA